MLRPRGLLLVAPVLLLAGAGSPDAADFTIVGGQARQLVLTVDRPAFDWPITVRRNDSGKEAATVCIDVTPLIGPSAQAATRQRLLVSDQPADRPCLALPPLGQGTVRLAGELPVEGAYTAQIGLIANDARTPFDVTLTRAKPGYKIGVVGAGSDGRLTLTSDRSSFSWPITLRRDDSLAGDVIATIAASPLTGPAGTIVSPALMRNGQPLSGPVSLAALREVPLTLVGKAELEGTYAGEVTYEVAGTRTAVPLTLTRTHPDFDLKIDSISKLRGTLWDDVVLQLRLQNATSAVRELYKPSIRLDRVDTSGSSPVELGAGGFDARFAQADGAALASPQPVAPDAGIELKVTVTGLQSAGTYKGVMRFTAPDRKPLDAPFELALRLPWGLAALSIAFGVVAAAAARYYQQTAQPRLLLQRDALGLRSALEELFQAERHDLAPREGAAITFLVGQLDRASDDLAGRQVTTADIGARIGRVRDKLPLLVLLISMRRRLDGVRPASVADGIRSDLDPTVATLMAEVPGANDIATRTGELNAIPGKITAGLQAHIQGAVATLRAAIDDGGGDPPSYQPVRTLLNQIPAAPAGPTLQPALALLDRARLRYVEIAANNLRRQLDPTTPTFGFNQQDWAKFVIDIGKRLDLLLNEPDAEARVRGWNDVNTTYLVEVLHRAKTHVDQLVAADVVPDATAIFKAAAGKLADAQTALIANNLAAANKAYGEAMAEVEKARPLMAKARANMATATGGEASAPGSGGTVPPSVVDEAIGSLLPLPLGRDATTEMIDRSMRRFAIGFTVVMLVIAVVTGLQLLYMPNPVFGWWDLVVGFLWGAGLHAVGGQSFQGLQALTQQFR